MRAKIIYLKSLLKILPEQIENINYHLIIEANHQGISFLIYTKEPLKIEGILNYSLQDWFLEQDVNKQLRDIVEHESVLKWNFSSVEILYNYDDVCAVPMPLFVKSESASILNLLFGENIGSRIFDEKIKGQDVINVYRVPSSIIETLKELFPFHTQYHSNTRLLALPNLVESSINCIISDGSIKIICFKNNQFQYIKQFPYQVASDVVYHVLNVAVQYELDSHQIPIFVSGMVEEKSALYKDLYSYFENIQFSTLPEQAEIPASFSEYPNHYFQHLIQLAACE